MSRSTPAEKLKDIRDAIESGMSGQDIRAMLHTSAGTITNVKRAMGIPIRPMRQTRTKGPVKSVASAARVAAQVVPEANITELAHNAWGSIRAEAPTAPPVPRPEAYVTAFENRVLEYRELLRQYEQTLLERDGTIERLKKENAKLLDEYAQTVFRQQNWQGPTSIMTQSLGNGG